MVRHEDVAVYGQYRLRWRARAEGQRFIGVGLKDALQIDWMALNGVNLPLAFNGQEAVMRDV
jgi:hypothetical protein